MDDKEFEQELSHEFRVLTDKLSWETSKRGITPEQETCMVAAVVDARIAFDDTLRRAMAMAPLLAASK